MLAPPLVRTPYAQYGLSPSLAVAARDEMMLLYISVPVVSQLRPLACDQLSGAVQVLPW